VIGAAISLSGRWEWSARPTASGSPAPPPAT
jgi:hypothetical protein